MFALHKYHARFILHDLTKYQLLCLHQLFGSKTFIKVRINFVKSKYLLVLLVLLVLFNDRHPKQFKR